MRLRAAGILLLLLFTGVANAQPLFDDGFPPQEFAERRARVMAAVGDGVAILQGATELPAYATFRQSNHFYYLTGVEVPRALVMVDGRARTTTLYLPARNERAERSEGPVLTPGDEAEILTGISVVRSRQDFGDDLVEVVGRGQVVHTPFRPETLAPRRALWLTLSLRSRTRGMGDVHVKKSLLNRFGHGCQKWSFETSTPFSIACG